MGKLFLSAPEIVAGISRRGVFWRGLLIFLIGIIIALHPFLTSLYMSVIFGWGLIFGGGWIMVSAFQSERKQWSWLVYGILVSLGGILQLCNPAAGLLAFAWTAAMLMLSGGIIGITSCLSAHHSSGQNVLCFLSWLCTILLGILLFLFPLVGMTELFWILGILLGAEGAALMIISFWLTSRKQPINKEANQPIA